ncbi:MAG: hypothetical protein NC417_11930 [Candidatus Gastranaerophilales bacterium]|nr:hypothetical protein [Candidatus Gastranaerophilales bacterium]
MKYKFRGAEIKKGSKVKAFRKPPKDKIRLIGKVVIALVCFSSAAIVAMAVLPLREGSLRFFQESSTAAPSAYNLPRNRTDLTGMIVSCDSDGAALVEYEGSVCENVQILDKELLMWLHDTNRSLESVAIRFATDENGDIKELGLLSADFFVIDADENLYTAVRDGQVIWFTATMSLEAGHCYEGYFSYPDMRLYWGKQQTLTVIHYIDPKCDDKKVTSQTEYYTGEEVNVYQIFAVGNWYYCTQEIYDSVQVGDLLDDYELYSDQSMDFMSVK